MPPNRHAAGALALPVVRELILLLLFLLRLQTGEVRNINFLPRPDPHTIFCNGMECDGSWDRDTCCAQRAECYSMGCPEGYVHSEWSIRTQIACDGIAYTVEADLGRCCFSASGH